MTKFWDAYRIPTSLDDALELLAHYDGRARIVAGGTDLLLDLKSDYRDGQREHYAALIDVTHISGACEIREDDGWIVVGCGVTHAQVVASPLMQSRATALYEAGSVIGGPQVRNVATVVGNIAHALPAADGLIALLVLGAEVEIRNSKLEVRNWLSLASLYLGPGKSVVDPTRELITAIRFRPTGSCEASAFTRVMRPQGVALPILAMAARVKLAIRNAQSTIEDLAVSAGPVAPTPFRARHTEDFLRGKVLDDATLTQATRILLNEATPRTSAHRATKEYRCELLPTMLREVLTRAVDRAKS